MWSLVMVLVQISSRHPEGEFAIAIYNRVDSYTRRYYSRDLNLSPCHDSNFITKLAVKDLALAENNRTKNQKGLGTVRKTKELGDFAQQKPSATKKNAAMNWHKPERRLIVKASILLSIHDCTNTYIQHACMLLPYVRKPRDHHRRLASTQFPVQNTREIRTRWTSC